MGRKQHRGVKSKLAAQLEAMWADSYVRMPGRVAGHLTEREAAERNCGYYLPARDGMEKHAVLEMTTLSAAGGGHKVKRVAPVETNALGRTLPPSQRASREPSDFMVVVPGRKL